MIYLKKFQILKFLFLLGNHDPYKKGSYYYDFKFEPNVYIFKGDFVCVQTDDCSPPDIDGILHSDPGCAQCMQSRSRFPSGRLNLQTSGTSTTPHK